MLTATSTQIIERQGNRFRFAVTLSDGRTMTTSGKTEAEAIKTILKHVNAAPVVETKLTAGDIANTIFAARFFGAEMIEFAARVAAAAEGNATMTDIVSKWTKYRTPSIAQAGAIARFAFANNITL